MREHKTTSIPSRGLKYKLKIAFSLMSILPLLVSMYMISHYILPTLGLRFDILVLIIMSVSIAVIGFFIIKEVFDRFTTISTEAKLIAAGDYQYSVREGGREDEVGDLENALNRLTLRIRSNMSEIEQYSEKTAAINMGVQKRVLVLSSLLQVSSLISEGAKLIDILRTIVERSKLLADSDIAYLLYREETQETFYIPCADGLNSQGLLNVKVEPTEDIFYSINSLKKALILDKESPRSDDLVSFVHKKLGLINTLALPVYLHGRIIALLGIGNSREPFVYIKEDIELLDVFAKQLAIAAENDKLSHSVKKLEVKDALTGLYNESFIRGRLHEEIKRAIIHQRPCAFIILDIDHFKQYTQAVGSMQTEAALKRIAVLIRDSVSEIDRVGRIGDDEFAIILPEKNKRQAQEIAEDIRKKVEFSYGEEAQSIKKITISAGVSENPLDGISSDELILEAEALLEIAKNQGRNRVVIFRSAK